MGTENFIVLQDVSIMFAHNRIYAVEPRSYISVIYNTFFQVPSISLNS
jgi:hypothetical protein